MMRMLLVVFVVAVISVAAVATGGVTANPGIAWCGVATSLFGLVLLMVDALRERERRDAKSGAAEIVHFDTRYPDYAPSDRPPHDAPIHDDHEVEREVIREERVLHPDTGPREQDISAIRATETIGETHFRAAKDRGERS
jgi:hypothetical protein